MHIGQTDASDQELYMAPMPQKLMFSLAIFMLCKPKICRM